MNQRIKGFVIRLTEKELAELDKKVKQSGLSREAYVRKVLAGAKLKVPPPLEYFRFKTELSRIGNNLNQIARVANISHAIDESAYRKNVKLLNEFYEWLMKQFE